MSEVANVVDELMELRAPRVLVRAARKGRIRSVECKMPRCYCPGGRDHFERSERPLGPWMPTADHIRRKMDGGTLALVNVRLGHRLCNFADFARKNHVAFDRYLVKALTDWYEGSRR
jgi:hypothetical protein